MVLFGRSQKYDVSSRYVWISGTSALNYEFELSEYELAQSPIRISNGGLDFYDRLIWIFMID